jgi:uncharacterized membrane protein YccC
MDNPTPLDVTVTGTRASQYSGTVQFSRRRVTGEFEQRTIRVRYGGRSALTVLFSIATVVLLFLHKDDWATLTAILTAAVVSSVMDRYRRDLRWITGYTDKPRRT